MYGKGNMETYITLCKIDSQQEFAIWLRKLKQGCFINLEGWDGEGGGKEVQKGKDICIPMADSCLGLTENSKILQSNYPSIKNKLKIRKYALKISELMRKYMRKFSYNLKVSDIT